MSARTRMRVSDERQMTLPLSPVRNIHFLSNHWLEHRLPLEPEWHEHADAAQLVLQRILSLWKKEKDRVEQYGDEAGLEEKFIQPVFKAIGWHLKYQPHLNNREPDYALFLCDDDLAAAISAGRTNPSFWEHAAAVADSKAWHINLDRPTRVGSAREYPPEQIEWYLNHSLRNFGILTNGRIWRLIPRVLGPINPRFQTFLEVDFPALMENMTPPEGQLELVPSGPEFDDFLRFYLLFGPAGHESINERKPLLQRAVEGSSEYSIGVSEELRDRVFEAQRLCIEGFLGLRENVLDPQNELRSCQENSLIFLYRLLFIMYAEDRSLLPYRRNQTYTNNRSLARHRDEVASRLDQVTRGLDAMDYSRKDTNLWDDLQDLFDLIDRGHKRYGVHAYNGGLFDFEADSFLSGKKLSDWYLSRILDQLGRAPQKNKVDLGLFRVDYRDLAIQQLGSVYEGLLELKPCFASCDMRVLRSRKAGSKYEFIQPESTPIPKEYERTTIRYKAGTIYLATDRGERRRTGSYYTPDHIVDQIVQKTLGAKCKSIFNNLQDEINLLEGRLVTASPEERPSLELETSKLRGAFDDRVLTLKILDPAMGSGHFLIRACQYLAEEIATNPYTSDPQSEDIEGDESTMTFWKRRIAENCLYGVDVNPMAVELAKLALWLETVAADSPLTFLDHHLQCGNSLVGATIDSLNNLPGDEGLLKEQFTREVETSLPVLLEPLNVIGTISSDTVKNVKEKEGIYRRRFLPARERFSAVANLWTAEAMCGGLINPDQYKDVLEALGTKHRFAQVLESKWARDALALLNEKAMVPFNWELAFPQVFLADGKCSQTVGFDVILGNPPYDVLSEKESNRNIDHLKRFIEFDSCLAPAQVGKSNLYKLFVARSVSLLAEGGYFSFIVPMTLLGDAQTSGIRRLLFSNGYFSEIHAFPQKDNVTHRVFPDAKLSTALFVYRKTELEKPVDYRFASYVHSGRYIEQDSSALWIDDNSIKVYDPENITIVSCTQEDWDLMASLSDKKMTRLSEYVTFFQGEVNQTVATSKGFLTEPNVGHLVTRGANISLYKLREASQGKDIFLNIKAYLEGRKEESKAFHHRYERVGLQESSAQNNFRRIIACRIPKDLFCNHKINYTTEKHTRVQLELILFVLNSSFADWYFRLGSTNAAVSHYQLRNIPCPRFYLDNAHINQGTLDWLDARLDGLDFVAVEPALLELAVQHGCTPTLQLAIVRLVRLIEDEEGRRGEITRTDRSVLSENANRCQVILDRLLLTLLGLNADKLEYIKSRLEKML